MFIVVFLNMCKTFYLILAFKVFFISSFSVFMPFIFIYCFIEMSSICNTILHINSGRWHSCLVLDIRGTAFNILLLNMLDAGFL